MEGFVDFDDRKQHFDYRQVEQFGNMEFSARSLVDASSSLFVTGSTLPYASTTQGGNVQIDARAILGTEFRDRLTPESDITASSEFGVSGEVDINILNKLTSTRIIRP